MPRGELGRRRVCLCMASGLQAASGFCNDRIDASLKKRSAPCLSDEPGAQLKSGVPLFLHHARRGRHGVADGFIGLETASTLYWAR
jgi:hypothetical protein